MKWKSRRAKVYGAIYYFNTLKNSAFLQFEMSFKHFEVKVGNFTKFKSVLFLGQVNLKNSEVILNFPWTPPFLLSFRIRLLLWRET